MPHARIYEVRLALNLAEITKLHYRLQGRKGVRQPNQQRSIKNSRLGSA